MRWLLLVISLMAGCDDFGTVQRTDTIEAYEAYVKENGETSANGIASMARLEILYKQQAEKLKTVEAYDAYLKRFPKGPNRVLIAGAKEELMFKAAEQAGTEAAWKAFLDGNPEAQARRVDMAKAGIEAANYASKLEIGPVRAEPVNLADDPKGPKNGTGFFAEVTNKGDKTLSLLWFNLVLPANEAGAVQMFDGLLVAPASASRMPIAAKDQVPFKPGETRTWSYTTDAVPPGFTGTAKLIPSRLKALAE